MKTMLAEFIILGRWQFGQIGLKLPMKLHKKTYSLSVWYNKISWLSPKICADATFETEAAA